MPFTFAHPFYIAPLHKAKPALFSVTGLVLGSLSPDYEYFLMLEPYRSIGHSMAGFWLHAVPFSLLFAFLFHRLVKEPFVRHLPSRWGLDRRAYRMVDGWKLRGLRDWLVFIVSVGIGFLSHITLDAFTHAGGFFVVNLELLRATALMNIPLYKILQHGFSLLGLAGTLAYVGYRMFRRESGAFRPLPEIVKGPNKLAYWCTVLLTAVGVTALKLSSATSGNTVGMLVVAPITGFGLGVVLASLMFRVKKR